MLGVIGNSQPTLTVGPQEPEELDPAKQRTHTEAW